MKPKGSIASPQAVQLELVLRQFWPARAGAAQRMDRYAPGLASRGVGMRAWVRQTQPDWPLREQSPGGVDIRRQPGQADRSMIWDCRLFEALIAEESPHLQRRGRVVQTNLAFAHTLPHLRRLRRLGHPTLWLGSMLEDISAGMSPWRRLRERLRLRWTLGGFDAHVVGSTAMRQWLRSFWIAPSSIQVIGHGVDLKRFHPCEPDQLAGLRRRLAMPLEAPCVLMVGSMIARKGVDLLLEAWPLVLQAHPGAQLVLIGEFERPSIVDRAERGGMDAFAQRIKRLMQPLIEAGALQHLEHCDQPQEWMAAADVMVLPSQREGVPNVVLEAMACGTPCVLTPFIGLPREELGPEGGGWLLTAADSQSLALRLLWLLDEPARLRAMSGLAAQWAHAHFDLQHTLDAQAALFGRLAAEAQGLC